jgi:2-dehydro-3-deoxygalactonokinase
VNEPRRVLCDWGSSRLRAFLEVEGVVSDRRDGPGINRLGADSPAEALSAVLAAWCSGHCPDVFLCGMAGSRNGLAEVPYVRAPATMEAWRRGRLRVRIEDLEASIAPGIRADNFRDVPDVMRGEETQIFGALALERQLAAGSRLIVLPGTHSKWVRVRDGAVARVQTYFTGELFDLLCRYSSLLRVGAEPAMDEGGFEAGLRAAARGGLAASLFETRTAQLLEGRSAGWARAFLSGLLIGAEVGSMVDIGVLASEPLTLIGDPELTAFYLRALAAQHISAQALDGERCVLAGLRVLADAERDS